MFFWGINLEDKTYAETQYEKYDNAYSDINICLRELEDLYEAQRRINRSQMASWQTEANLCGRWWTTYCEKIDKFASARGILMVYFANRITEIHLRITEIAEKRSYWQAEVEREKEEGTVV